MTYSTLIGNKKTECHGLDLPTEHFSFLGKKHALEHTNLNILTYTFQNLWEGD